MKSPVRVTVTGAAGQISYSLLFRIAAGEMLGADQPVILQMLEITPALEALKGVAMELEDCAFPLLTDMVCTDDAAVAFKDTDYALLVGARPRGPGMERKDLLEANAAIFSAQGKAIDANASKAIKVLVVGNPANTNSLIAQRNAPSINPRQFTAMTRLDHNRALSQIAAKTGTTINDVTHMTIWGNHSATQYPDIHQTKVNGQAAIDMVDQDWYENDFIPVVQQRGVHAHPGEPERGLVRASAVRVARERGGHDLHGEGRGSFRGERRESVAYPRGDDGGGGRRLSARARSSRANGSDPREDARATAGSAGGARASLCGGTGRIGRALGLRHRSAR